MTTFTRTWDASYEANPADSQEAKQGAARIREVKVDVGERLEVDHSWAGDADDGVHKQITLLESGSDPTPAADRGFVYIKDVGGGSLQAFYEDESGNVTQLTAQFPAGIVQVFAGSSAPSGWFICDGSEKSRTTYAALYAVIGETYGNGNGTTTFNIPDLTGRTVFGKEASATRLTAGISGLDSTALGDAGGHQDIQAHDHGTNTGTESATHTHQAQGTHAVIAASLPSADVYFNSGGSTTTGTESATHTHAITSEGTGDSGNIPPALIMNWIIKY